MADGSTAPAGLTDAGLRRLALDLAPLAALDSIAGLVARYRDPRERPGTGGEQRDAAAALDDASERGQLTAARIAWVVYVHLDAEDRRTAWWIAQRGRAVRDGDIALDLESAGGDATLALGAIVTVLGDHGFHAQVIHVEDCQACDQAQERRGDCAMCGGSFYVPLGPTPDPQGNA